MPLPAFIAGALAGRSHYPFDGPAMRQVGISREPVELYKILKFAGLVSSGGEAKSVIAAGEVKVNGVTETQKRKKIASGDVIEFAQETIGLYRE